MAQPFVFCLLSPHAVRATLFYPILSDSLSEAQWEQVPETEREEMIERQVWDDQKREEYLREKTIEQNRRGGGMRKRVNRMKKNYVPPPVMEGDM